MTTYRTIARPVCVEIGKIKGSRFIADAATAGSVDEARAFLQSIRETFPDATHHCSAWRIDEHESRANDDGEPSGSAGAPILRQIDGVGVIGTVIVVTRYFGGTKLGTGGLIRAYGAAARAALDAADVIEHIVTRTLHITHGYELTATVQSVLSAYHLEPIDPHYETDVRFTIAIPEETADELVRELTERTGGRVRIEGDSAAGSA
ncbi:MAG: YigZ family protein [Phycisphaerales bacterium]|nr:YigZ family protein [Phycisphaerales bacterium]